MKKYGIGGVAFRPFGLMLRLAPVPKCSAKSGSSDDENTLPTTISRLHIQEVPAVHSLGTRSFILREYRILQACDTLLLAPLKMKSDPRHFEY